MNMMAGTAVLKHSRIICNLIYSQAKAKATTQITNSS